MLNEKTVRPKDLDLKIGEIEDSVEKYGPYYRKCLYKLVGEVQNIQPQTIFFLDRSARPVAWMLKGYWQGLLESGLIPKDYKFPDIRFMSVDTGITPSSTSIEEARKRYTIDQDQPVLIVDEFTESGRTQQLAKETMEKVFPETEIHATNFFGNSIPEFKRQSYIYGRALYGIGDTEADTILSKPAKSEHSFVEQRKRVRKIFTDFGKRCAFGLVAEQMQSVQNLNTEVEVLAA